MRTRALNRVAAAALLCGWSLTAAAFLEGTTTQGTPFISGGVTAEELQTLNQRKPEFSLWVQTAAKGSGAHLAGALVRVTDTKGGPILETEMDGPWLFARLAPGNYVIETTFEGKTEKRTVSIGKSGLRQVFLYFSTEAELSPDLEKDAAKK
jgi:hypothetical protein